MVVSMLRLGHGGMGRRRGAGFTLVEMLVVLVILMILMGLIFVPMYQSFRATKRAETSARLQDQTTQALQRIVSDLEEAMFIYTPPAPSLYSDPGMPDAVYLPFLDVSRPATDDEVMYDNPGGPPGSGPGVPGNPDKLAFPSRPSERIIRYFVAPLPGQPAGTYLWGENPPGLQGYLNPFFDLYADPAQENLATLYRAEFTLDEVTAAGGFATTVSYADLRDPYFYTGLLSGVTVPNPAGLGRYWKTVSMPLTDEGAMDCALYEYDPALDDEAPVIYTPSAGLPGALPGLSLQPTVIPQEAALPSKSREATGYKTQEQLWGPLTACLIQHFNPEAGPGVPYTAETAVNNPGGQWPVGILGFRLLPEINPVTGELRYARRTSDVYYADSSGNPINPAPWNQLQTDNPIGPPVYPHLYRVSYGGLRLPPMAPDEMNQRHPRFKVVTESEIVRLVNRVTGEAVQCKRVETEPSGPFEYRIDYNTGVLRFDKLNYPDPSVFEIWVEYDYRDNFVWSANDPRGFVDDTLLVTYVTYREINVGLSVTAYDIGSGEAIPLSLARMVRLRNTIR